MQKQFLDRSGELEFPYREMVREWNGSSKVHFTKKKKSEFEWVETTTIYNVD